MSRKRFFRAALILVVGAVFTATAFMPAQQASASFDKDYIMSDAVFENAATMGAGEINAFLNQWPNSCISPNRGFKAPSLTGYSPSGGYTYGADVTAGEVIHTAASVYGLNPQVILATLEKEQSLVRGNAGCTPRRYVSAMGNGCPDNVGTFSYSGFTMYVLNGNPVSSIDSTCVNNVKYVGFSRQIITATWRLKFWQERSRGHTSWAVIKPGWDNSDDPPTCYSHRMTAGYRKRCQNGTNDFYDGLYTIDGQTTRMGSGATAALYTYTPHFHGNQNFVALFEGPFGFGSVHSGMLSIAHPDGTLVRPANSPEVYLLKNGQAQYTRSLGVFKSWGFDFNRLKIATQGDLHLMAATDADSDHSDTPAPMQFREGTLVKGSAPTVYVIQNVSGNNTKRSLDSLENFQRLGYGPNDIITVPDSELPSTTGSPITMAQAQHPEGTMVKNANDPTVYYIIGGERHSMTSGAIFNSHGFTFDKVKPATAGDNALPITWPVTWYGEGVLMRGSGPTVYVIDNDSIGINSSKRSFGTYYNFVGLDYRFNEVMWLSDGDIPTGNGPNIGQ
jgi:hypothetical protein